MTALTRFRQRTIRTLATLIATASLIGVGLAAPAIADVQPTGTWNHSRWRMPTDGDDGGVSGRVRTWWNTSIEAEAEFRAYGEWVHIANRTNAPVRVSLYIPGAHSYLSTTVPAQANARPIDLSIAEGINVSLQICLVDRPEPRECTTIHDLVT